MFQRVLWKEADAQRDRDALTDTGEVRWESRWRAGEGSAVPASHGNHDLDRCGNITDDQG